ncbi:hypothetical protein BURMUCF2_A0723 [Burkholderia multivorans CF2]|nr:hypothetical protein BURMUCF2_A0723 [Burkholderia multivorans CF2]
MRVGAGGRRSRTDASAGFDSSVPTAPSSPTLRASVARAAGGASPSEPNASAATALAVDLGRRCEPQRAERVRGNRARGGSRPAVRRALPHRLRRSPRRSPAHQFPHRPRGYSSDETTLPIPAIMRSVRMFDVRRGRDRRDAIRRAPPAEKLKDFVM